LLLELRSGRFASAGMLLPQLGPGRPHPSDIAPSLDGASHFPPPVSDRKRDAWLAAAGLTTLRFENWQILHNTAAVLRRIAQAIQAARSTH
jgi:hypothetical protein